MKSPYQILVRPLITEHAVAQKDQNKYVFQVAIDSNKYEIKAAVERAFGVEVTSVNTTTTKGRRVQRQRTRPGRTADVKKAIITLAKGQALEL